MLLSTLSRLCSLVPPILTTLVSTVKEAAAPYWGSSFSLRPNFSTGWVPAASSRKPLCLWERSMRVLTSSKVGVLESPNLPVPRMTCGWSVLGALFSDEL